LDEFPFPSEDFTSIRTFNIMLASVAAIPVGVQPSSNWNPPHVPQTFFDAPGSQMPLQTRTNEMTTKPADKTVTVEKTAASPRCRKKVESMLKSPITMCFERMLGAGTL
jgi:hypothetical protein